MDLRDVEDVDIGILHEFRTWAFPQAVSNPNHEPYFSLEDPASWATLDALKLFIGSKDHPEALAATHSISVKDLKALRSLLLPKNLLSSPYFSLENRKNWTRQGPLQAFQNAGLLTRHGEKSLLHGSASSSMKFKDQTPSLDTDGNDRDGDRASYMKGLAFSYDTPHPDDPWAEAPSGTAQNPLLIDASPSESEHQPNLSLLGLKASRTPGPGTARAGLKRKRHQRKMRDQDSAPTVIPISDSESDLPELQLQPAKKRSRAPTVDSDYRVSKLESDSEPDTKKKRSQAPNGTVDSDYRVSKLESDSESDTNGPAGTTPKSSRIVPPRPIQITRSRSVTSLVDLDEIPEVWTIPRDKSAYRLDFSRNPHANDKTIESLIRHEAQDSWKVDSRGSSDHSKGDATCVKGILAAYAVRVRRITAHCRGVKICSEFPKEIWLGMERYEPELEWRQELRTKRLDAHEHEQYNIRPTSLFYRQIIRQRCEVPNCPGRAVIRKSTKRSTSTGQDHFIGCSAWSPAGGRNHLYSRIPDNVDVDELQHMLSNDGQARKLETVGSECSMVLRFGSHRKECPLTHIVTGKTIKGTFQEYKCQTRLTIYVPTAEFQAKGVKKAIVILEKPHTHPLAPDEKPTHSDALLVREAISTAGAKGLTAGKFVQARTTHEHLGGKSLSAVAPGMATERRLRYEVELAKKAEYPYGFGWGGLMDEIGKEAALPLNKRYIHYADWNHKRQLVVTMLPGIANYFHQARHLAVDFTFKRVKGDMNQWDVATNFARFNERMSNSSMFFKPKLTTNISAILASIYCDKADRETYEELFNTLFKQIEILTGKRLLIFLIHGQGVRVFLTDCEVPETQGLGDALVKVNKACPNSPLRGIDDPLKLVTYVGKLCKTHFHRRIDDMKDVPKDVRDHLRSFPFLRSDEEIEAFDEFCLKSPYKKVKDWWQHKKVNPHLRPMLNKFLSPMDEESWSTTPNTTNEVESAHAGQNKDTGIGRSLLEAILELHTSAKKRDIELLARWEAQEAHGSLKKTWNYNIDRSIRSSQRQTHHARETAKKKVATDTYGELRKELKELEESLQLAQEESRSIQIQVDKFKESGITAKSSGPNGDEFRLLSDLLHDIRSEIKEIRTTIKEKKAELVDFRDRHNLKHVRLPKQGPVENQPPSVPPSVTPSPSSLRQPETNNTGNMNASAGLDDEELSLSDSGLDIPIDESYYLGSPAKSCSSRVSTPSRTPNTPRARPPTTATFQSTIMGPSMSTPIRQQENGPLTRPRAIFSPALELFDSNLYSSVQPFELEAEGPDPFTTPNFPLDSVEAPGASNNTVPSFNLDLDLSLLSDGNSRNTNTACTPHDASKSIECDPNHPEDWLTPNKSRMIQDAQPSLWKFMLEPSLLGGSSDPRAE